MSPNVKELFELVESWPEEDQEELANVARGIEARRSGIHRATPEELHDIAAAEQSGMATQQDVEAAFRSFRRK